MVFKINSEKFIEIGAMEPNTDFVFAGWDYKIKTFLGFPYFVYTKKLYK